MKGQDLFEAMSYVRDDIIEESLDMYEDADIVAPPVRESLLARFFQSNWGVAMICAVVSLSVLSGIIWAGHHDPFGHGHGGTEESETDSEDVTEPITEISSEEETTISEETPTTDWRPDIPEEPETHTPIEPGDFGTEPSEGLEYRLTGDYYTVVGMGSCTDAKLVIPAEYEGKPVKMIGEGAFGKYDEAIGGYVEHKGITSVVVSEGIERIEGSAFIKCSSLRNIQLPSTLKYLGGSVFNGCSALIELSIPEGVAAIPGGMCWDCISLLKVTLPSTVKTVQMFAFLNCGNLYEVNLPEGLETLEDGVFQGCHALKEIYIPSTIKSIQAQSLRDGGVTDSSDAWIHHLYYGGTLEQYMELYRNTGVNIYRNAINFYIDGQLLEYLTVPENSELKQDMFSYCQSLKGVILPESISSSWGWVEDQSAFAGGYYVTNRLFADCPNLEWIVIQGALSDDRTVTKNNVTRYYSWLFQNFTKNLPDEHTSQGNYLESTVSTIHVYVTDTEKEAASYISNYLYLSNLDPDNEHKYPNVVVHYGAEWHYDENGHPTLNDDERR